jgi:hypothetical protein
MTMGHSLKHKLAAPFRRSSRQDVVAERLDRAFDRMASEAGDRAHWLADRLAAEAHHMADRFGEKAKVAAHEAKARSRQTLASQPIDVQAVKHDLAGLVPHRQAKSWRTVNVGPRERVVSLLAGVPMVVVAARRRDAAGGALGVVGGEMVYRGLTGHCPVYQAAGIDKVSRSRFALPV